MDKLHLKHWQIIFSSVHTRSKYRYISNEHEDNIIYLKGTYYYTFFNFHLKIYIFLHSNILFYIIIFFSNTDWKYKKKKV